MALQGVDGVAEVASIGGFVKEYQVDVDPDALRTYGIALHDVYNAVRASNIDVGARTIEINAAEYVVRGLGLLESLDDLRRTVITQRDNVPVTLDQIAEIEFGPALRRGGPSIKQGPKRSAAWSLPAMAKTSRGHSTRQRQDCRDLTRTPEESARRWNRKPN